MKDIFHRKFIDFTIGGHYNCNNDIKCDKISFCYEIWWRYGRITIYG